MQSVTVSLSDIKDNSNIIKPNYHLNYGKKRIATAIKKGKEYTALGDIVKKVYTGGIFKRVFVEDIEYGIPYISAQHMMNANPLEVAKIISKKYTPRQDDMTLKENQILVSCAGTVGNVRLISKDLDGIIGSQDIIRVIADNNKAPYGFVYAYLASKTAYNYIQSFIYGSVVPRIDPKTLAKLPIPIFQKEKQKEIHQLIVDAANLRVEANKLLEEAVRLFNDSLPDINFEKNYKVSLSLLKEKNYRINASTQIQKINQLYSKLEKKNEIKTIGELSKEVFTPGIFKRVRVNDAKKGIPFLSGSDLLNQQPQFDDFLSKTMKNIDNYILRKGWIAIQDAGTIGYVSIINEYLDGASATNNLVRIIPNENEDENNNYYIYAFLKTDMGQIILKSNEFGSVQKHIDNTQISEMKIPVIKSIYKKASENIEIMINNQAEASKKENQAISLIEKEIDLWQN